MNKDELLDRLQHTGFFDEGENWEFKAAGGGLNTEVYFAENPATSSSLTIRLGRAGSDLRREAQYLARLTDCPGIPAVRHVDRDLLVHETLPGEPAPLAEATEDDLDSLARVLACIHTHENDHYVVWPDLSACYGPRSDLLRARIASLPGYRSFNDPPLDALLMLYQALQDIEMTSTGWDDGRYALIHGDLSVGNILWSDGGVSLIDWEYARPSDPAEELAYLVSEQPVPDETVQRLRDAYIGHGGPPDAWDRVAGWLPFTTLDSALWWCDHLLERGEDPAGHPEVQARIETARRYLG